jgi:ATP-dependent DNA helicase PIF1
MKIKQIENIWRQNFKKSPLITDGTFNPSIAHQLYYGPDKDSDLPFKEGFRDFNDNCYISDTESNIASLLQYLHFIGITISQKSISDSIASGTSSYKSILKKAFYIFKHLAGYGEDLNIDDPYQENMGDLDFFLRIEEGANGEAKQLTLFDELELPDFYNKYIELPAGYENDKTAQKLFDLIENSDKSIFLTGKAGTGKSTFIHYFTKNTEKNVLLLAFTGIAAINIGGQTIHSFFRFPLKPLLPNDPDITIFKPFFQKRKILEKTDTIIIDEVSMLRSDILEGLDYSLRRNGGNPNKIFGGKQLILVGDIFQLPPVIDNADEVESELFKIIYDSEYFFDSVAYKQLNPETFEFNKVHRQTNEEFISLLNKVRDSSIDINGIDELNKRYNPSFTPKPEEFVITLTTNNYLAKSENVTKLNSLPYKSHFFKANITGDFKEHKYPTEPVLELRRNSQILFVKNDSIDKGRRWVNGTIAKIEFIDDEKIEIRLKDGSAHTLQKETWENRQYQWDKNKGRITSKVVGTFEQYPVKLAWAITIHKSQGLTFDNVIIDLGSGAFINGQLYTALSRCRTLEGLVLKKKIRYKDIITDFRLVTFSLTNLYLLGNKFNEVESLKSTAQITWDNVFSHKNFFTALISLHHPFTTDEISKYLDLLSNTKTLYYLFRGDEYQSNIETEDVFVMDCSKLRWGIHFNQSIQWDNNLRSIWAEKVTLFKLENDRFPLSIKKEIDFYLSYNEYLFDAYDSVTRSIEIEDYMDFDYNLDEKRYNEAIEIQSIERERRRNVAIEKDISFRNQLIGFNYLNFNLEYFIKMYNDHDYEMIKFVFNNEFYSSLIKMLSLNIPEFSIDLFFMKLSILKQIEPVPEEIEPL